MSTLTEILMTKGRILHRHCRICYEPIYLSVSVSTGKPQVESCSCRQLKRRSVVPVKWSDVEELESAIA